MAVVGRSNDFNIVAVSEGIYIFFARCYSHSSVTLSDAMPWNEKYSHRFVGKSIQNKCYDSKAVVSLTIVGACIKVTNKRYLSFMFYWILPTNLLKKVWIKAS